MSDEQSSSDQDQQDQQANKSGKKETLQNPKSHGSQNLHQRVMHSLYPRDNTESSSSDDEGMMTNPFSQPKSKGANFSTFDSSDDDDLDFQENPGKEKIRMKEKMEQNTRRRQYEMDFPSQGMDPFFRSHQRRIHKMDNPKKGMKDDDDFDLENDIEGGMLRDFDFHRGIRTSGGMPHDFDFHRHMGRDGGMPHDFDFHHRSGMPQDFGFSVHMGGMHGMGGGMHGMGRYPGRMGKMSSDDDNMFSKKSKPAPPAKTYSFNQKTPEDVALPFYDIV